MLATSAHTLGETMARRLPLLEVARVLGLSERTVRWRRLSGALAGEKDPASGRVRPFMMPDEVSDTPADAALTPDHADHDLRQRVAVTGSPAGGDAARTGVGDGDAGHRAAALRRPARDIRDHAAPVTGVTHPSAAGAGRVGGGRPEMGTIIWHALTATIATYAIGVLGARIGWDTTAFGVVIINGILIFIPHDNSDDAAL